MLDALGWAAFLLGFAATLVLTIDRGYRPGMRFAWFVATLAVPAWLFVPVRSITLDAVSGVALATLVTLLIRPAPVTRWHWAVSDLAIVGVVLSALVSELANRTLIPGTVIELVRTWVLPYVVGRVFIASVDDLDGSLPIVVAIATALSAMAVFEALAKVNMLAIATGKSWTLLEGSEGFRWGLKRAQVTTNHPIYFGLLMCLTLPWLLVAARESLAGRGPRWWVWAPVAGFVAAFVTVSRSAQAALVLVLVADLFFRRPNYRGPIVALAVIGTLLFFAFRQDVVDLLGAYAGEAEVGSDLVMIYGTEYIYTGTRHRDLLLLAYEEAIDGAGLLGYGIAFQAMPRDPEMDPRFLSIDHHYLMHYLRFGSLGVAAFFVFVATGLINLARVGLDRINPLSGLAAGLFGAFLAVAIGIRGVALAPDFGATWLFVAGMAASMVRHGRTQIEVH